MAVAVYFTFLSHILSSVAFQRVGFQKLKPVLDIACCGAFLLQIKGCLFAVWLLGSWRKFEIFLKQSSIIQHSLGSPAFIFFPKSSQAAQFDVQDMQVHITSTALDLCYMSGTDCDPNHVRRGSGLIQTLSLLIQNPNKN